MPVFLGDESLKQYLPHPKAAIFVRDYSTIPALVAYLKYLTTNETAYNEHLTWRESFSREKNLQDKPMLQDSDFCRVCQWAVQQSLNKTQTHAKSCISEKDIDHKRKGSADNDTSFGGVYPLIVVVVIVLILCWVVWKRRSKR